MFYEDVGDMECPTHPRLHLRDARDAHTVFEAVRQSLLRPVKRRLNETERQLYIKSGSIFVWEESEEESGLRRWTDGRIWSQSRMREPYLFYDEKVSSNEDSGGQSLRSAYRFVEGPSRIWTSSAQSHYERSDHHPTGLVKQAYSAWVFTSPNAEPRKWHLTAYFTYADLPKIPTIDQDPMLRRLVVPQGVYKSAKSRSRNADTARTANSLSARSSSPAVPENDGAFRGREALTLPSLPTNLANTQHTTGETTRLPRPRLAEDERMIQMLNAKPII
ncbi:uncharacterized protein LAESUDRAFT_810689 [Laetiporus sulphureus 93-53]|uniref:Gti1/Pac2 family-domain-containing protein n=1 Tax=Laetiporus sulphureus 93-53 TaxID=1314785 RepID=A0A165G216_9APHY|nr:uncharacterized protein LAESUDRAFT_810689 [Laetiporus sulphureus 93-53]KZT09723.1 hypothetical protein LAESUDRAFT_810689 [Laetiporus sulphureus 93-53]